MVDIKVGTKFEASNGVTMLEMKVVSVDHKVFDAESVDPMYYGPMRNAPRSKLVMVGDKIVFNGDMPFHRR